VENSAQFSPDGNQVAFQSSRSGDSEIWLCNSDGSNPVQLTSRVGAATGSPQWSPDGHHLVFHAYTDGQGDLYAISAMGGSPRRLTRGPDDETQASWSRDGRWIYYGSNRGGERQIWKMPVEGGQSVPVTRAGGITGQESPDGRFFYYSKAWRGELSLWRLAPAEQQVLKSIHNHSAFAVVDDGIYFIEKSHATGGASIRFIGLSGGQAREIMAADKPVVVGLTVSPDRGTILYTQVDREDSDLMLIENFR